MAQQRARRRGIIAESIRLLRAILPAINPAADGGTIVTSLSAINVVR